MTIGQYISSKFRAFGVTEAQLADVTVAADIDPGEEYSRENATAVGKAMLPLLEELILAPRQRSISEQGFSVSWDFDGLGRWYMWLSRKYGYTPDDDVLESLGLSRIIDRTSMW